MSTPNNAARFKNEKVMLRFALGLLALAGLFMLIRWILEIREDPDLIPGVSTGMVAAIEFKENGQQLVIFDEKGNKSPVPGWSEGKVDETPIWRPDGQRLFFTSDREDNTFNIFRYRPTARGAEKRSLGSRSKGKPWFGPRGHKDENVSALVASGPSVTEYNPKAGTTRQILPPPSGEATGDAERGVQDQVTAFYQNLGKAFIEAKWGPEREVLFASMQNDELQLLIGQNMTQTQTGFAAPTIYEYGRQILFDVSVNGDLLVVNNGFEFPPLRGTESEAEAYKNFIKDGKLVKPYANVLYLVKQGSPDRKVLFASKDGLDGFGSALISPEGGSVLLQAGSFDESDNFTPKALILLSMSAETIGEGKVIATGNVYEPSWSADGKKVYYIKADGGSRDIAIYDIASGQETFLAKGTGEYAYPVPSPMLPKNP